MMEIFLRVVRFVPLLTHWSSRGDESWNYLSLIRKHNFDIIINLNNVRLHGSSRSAYAPVVRLWGHIVRIVI